MIKAIIVDDERLARQELKRLLATHQEIEIIGECENADIAQEMIAAKQPDLIFLDIQMPGKTGFELLESMEGPVPDVIFVTAYDEYAIKAFEVNALDYLLKPIEESRLSDAIQKMLAHKNQEQEEQEQEPATSENEHVLEGSDQVFVKDGEKCWFVKLSEIRLFESEGNYVRVYFESNKPLILKSLNNLDQRLSQKLFFRANRKHIINLHWVEKIEPWFNGGLLVVLKGGEKVEISRRQAVKLKERMSL